MKSLLKYVTYFKILKMSWYSANMEISVLEHVDPSYRCCYSCNRSEGSP
jgi:hypothetical protein